MTNPTPEQRTRIDDATRIEFQNLITTPIRDQKPKPRRYRPQHMTLAHKELALITATTITGTTALAVFFLSLPSGWLPEVLEMLP